MRSVSVRDHTARIDNVAEPADGAFSFQLLTPVPVAAELNIGLKVEAIGGGELGEQADDAACGVPIEDGARTADDLGPPGGAKGEVCRLSSAVRSRDRNAVLHDLHAAHARCRERRADGEPHPARQAEVVAVFGQQAGHAGERLSRVHAALSRTGSDRRRSP